MKKLYKAGRWVVRKLPTILAIGASVGVIITAVSSGKAMIRATQLKMEAEQIKGCELSKKEAILAQAPAYILPIVSAGLTIGCIFGCNYLNRKQQTSLAAAAVAIQKSYNAYKNKVIEEFGEDIDQAVKQALVEESAQNENLPMPTDGNVLVHDPITDSWKCMSMTQIMECEYEFNHLFTWSGLVSVADYCNIFGFDIEPGYDAIGWNVGWFYDGGETSWLDFGNREMQTQIGTDYISLDPMYGPMVNYEDYDYMTTPRFWKKCIQIEPRENSDSCCGKEMTA